jgi:hypothetical protein
MGDIIIVNGSPVQSSIIDKTKINKSSCKAEYIALSKAILNTFALKSILLEKNFPNCGLKVKFYTDNEAVKDIVKGDASNKRVRLIDIAYHYIKDELPKRKYLH